MNEIAKLALKCRQFQDADGRIRLEEDEHVDVAVVAKVVAQCGSEERKLLDVVFVADARDRVERKIKCGGSHRHPILRRLDLFEIGSYRKKAGASFATT